ncbi:MAG: hypothetical protein JWO04_3540 [Gammaproteobacteria bacterium]|nr:hypothetical protein [Gammaproteobacteria bacterium]
MRRRHIKRLSDEGGIGWLVDVRCKCGRSGWRKPADLAREIGWDATLESLQQRMRCTHCGDKGLEVAAVPEPRPRGIPKNPR